MSSNYRIEFHDFGELPPLVRELHASGELIDISYHNDAMPSFVLPDAFAIIDREGSAENVPVLWVDYADDAKREEPGNPRFCVSITITRQSFQTDDEAQAIAHLRSIVKIEEGAQ